MPLNARWQSFACPEDGLIHAGRTRQEPLDPNWRMSWPWFACGLAPSAVQPQPEEMVTCLNCIVSTANIVE